MSVKTRLEVDTKALAHNYQYLRAQIDPSTQFMAVVKANAYGTDLVKFSQLLDDLGADSFCVAYVEEGLALREAGITKPILVLHAQLDTLEAGITAGLDFSLYSTAFTSALAQVAHRLQQKIEVHINLNTGLNRLGLKPKELNEALELIENAPELRCTWMMTHLAASEDRALCSFTLEQIAHFNEAHRLASEHLGVPLKRHVLNSSGIHNYPKAAFECVRAGISLHGYANDPVIDKKLIPISSLYSSISAIREIETGESVSYNRQFFAQQPMRIATVGIGHGDGIHRSLGTTNFKVMVNGQMAPAVGMICMDLFMIDITDIAAEVGDTVLIFGPAQSAEVVSTQAETIAYELITGIGPRVPRVFL